MKRIIAATALAAVGSLGLAAPALAGGYGKVWVCHVPPGNPDNAHSIHVDAHGWNGHKNHKGDYEGKCKVTPTPEPTPTTPTSEPTTVPTVTPTTEPTSEPTVEPSTEPTTQPTSEPTTQPTTVPTTEPTSEPTTEPTATPTTEPTQEPTSEPTTEPTVEPSEPITEPTVPTTEPVAVVAMPTLPSGSTWHDCEIGWTYDLDASYDWEFTRVWFTDPYGVKVRMSDGATAEGPHMMHVRILPGKTYQGTRVAGLDLEPGWTAVAYDGEHVTEAARKFDVVFADEPECGEILSPPQVVEEPADVAPSTATTPPTTKHLAATGAGDSDLWRGLGFFLLVAGAAVLLVGRWKE